MSPHWESEHKTGIYLRLIDKWLIYRDNHLIIHAVLVQLKVCLHHLYYTVEGNANTFSLCGFLKMKKWFCSLCEILFIYTVS